MTFKKIMISTLAIALSMTLASGVFAATTAKKKSAKKSTKKAASYSSENKVAEGLNVSGRTGLLLSESAQAPEKGKFGLAGHLLFMTSSMSESAYGYDVKSSTTNIQVPVGVSYGVAKNFELGASLDFISASSSYEVNGVEVGDSESTSGLGDLTFGGKYVIEGKNSPVNFGFGADVEIGPLSSDFGDSSTTFIPKGMVTYAKDSLLLNGNLNLVIPGAEGADTFVQVGAGAGLALSPKLTGIAELGLNGFGKEASVLGVGIRTAGKTKLQALLGIGIGDASPDFVLGAGVCF